MKALLVGLVLALICATSAWAGSSAYAGSSSWPAGQAYGSSFSSSWFQNIFYKTVQFDTTVTFIDNASYGWHATVRSWSTYVETHWLSSQTKKAHCRANTSASAWASCTVYS